MVNASKAVVETTPRWATSYKMVLHMLEILGYKIITLLPSLGYQIKDFRLFYRFRVSNQWFLPHSTQFRFEPILQHM